MNCQKCLAKCKAGCCGVIPFDRAFLKRHKPVREVLKEIDTGEFVILETEDMACPFLQADYACAVYADRPDVCRLYGNETQINLTCQWLDKNGRERSRPERRQVERKITKFMDNFIKYAKQN
jgi:Fe-S-cluster containining protein